jgi:hypothetical protein
MRVKQLIGFVAVLALVGAAVVVSTPTRASA